MKKPAVLLLVVLSLFAASATAYDISLGHRDAVVFDTPVFPQISVTGNHLRGELRILGADQSDLLFTYFTEGKHFGFETGFHAQTTGLEALSFSPFADATYTQEFGFMTLRLELGAQVSVLKTKYVKQYMFAFMPVFSAEMTFSLNRFALGLYLDDHNINDMAWRTFPVFGAKVSYRACQSVTLYTDVWARATEYLVDRWLMISSGGFRVGARIER